MSGIIRRWHSIATFLVLTLVITSCTPTAASSPNSVPTVGRSATLVAAASPTATAPTATAIVTKPTPSVAPTSGASAATSATGTARVAYAGSLVQANEQVVGPGFEKATGTKYLAVKAGGSFGVAKLIAAHQVEANVFESVGSAPITDSLTPSFTRWYVPFAASPLVIAYSPKSPYAAEFRDIAAGKRPLKDLFALMEKPSFHLGRTNPVTDPQGQAFVFMMELAAKKYAMPDLVTKALGSPTDNAQQIYGETSLLTYLQSGQLDAASAFLSQAKQKHLDYIALPSDINLGDPTKAAEYAMVSLKLPNGTVIRGVPLVLYIATLQGAPDQAAAVSFVHFVVSPRGKALYQKEGYTPVTSTIEGDARAAPAEIRAELHQ